MFRAIADRQNRHGRRITERGESRPVDVAVGLPEIAEDSPFTFELERDRAGGRTDALGREHLEVGVADGDRDAAVGRGSEVANLFAPVAVGFLAGGEDDPFRLVGPGEHEADVAESVIVARLA